VPVRQEQNPEKRMLKHAPAATSPPPIEAADTIVAQATIRPIE
jgi:hypothetical protein